MTNEDTYELESIEQLRAVADELRLRILRVLAQQAMTVTQVGDRLGIAPARIHYHVRELERVGLVRLVETREKGGILEKYYRPIAQDMTVPRRLLETATPDEYVTAANEILQDITRGFVRALSHAEEARERGDRSVAMARAHYWLTDEELQEVLEAVSDALRPYEEPRGLPGERERSFAQLVYDTELAAADADADSPPASTPRILRSVSAGALSYTREALERHAARAEQLDVATIGLVQFDDDVTADLIDRTIVRFRHKGILSASPEVRDALARKAVQSDPGGVRYGPQQC